MSKKTVIDKLSIGLSLIEIENRNSISENNLKHGLENLFPYTILQRLSVNVHKIMYLFFNDILN